MTGVQSVSSINNKPILRADNTGYAALTGLAMTTVAAVTKKEYHKPLAFVTVCLALLHLGVIIRNHKEWQRKQKEFMG